MTSLARGLVRTAGGTVILSWAHLDISTLAVLVGIVLGVQGFLALAEAYMLRRHQPERAGG